MSRGAGRDAVDPLALETTDSNVRIASWTAVATTSPAVDNWSPSAGFESRTRRAARQIGHHWHSGDSPTSGGISVVAVSQTSDDSVRPPPSVRLTCPLISLPTLLALLRRSQRWKSFIMSEAGLLCRDRLGRGDEPVRGDDPAAA